MHSSELSAFLFETFCDSCQLFTVVDHLFDLLQWLSDCAVARTRRSYLECSSDDRTCLYIHCFRRQNCQDVESWQMWMCISWSVQGASFFDSCFINC